MTSTALLLKEIETMPEETAARVLDFALFIKSKKTQARPHNRIPIQDAYGIFRELKGMDTTIEREDDRL